MDSEQRRAIHKRIQQQHSQEQPYEGYGEPKIGWYIDVPQRLSYQFDKMFPDRGSKVILVVTAIQHAIKVAPAALNKLYQETANECVSNPTGDTSGVGAGDSTTQEDGTVDSDSGGSVDAADPRPDNT